MSRIQPLLVFSLLTGLILAQPRIMVNLNGGYYEPKLPGFDANDQFPSTNIFTKNILLGYGFSYQFFYNARLGVTTLNSFQTGKIQNGARFSRRLAYRMLTIETFFIFKKRLEWNFTLAPMWNKGVITLDTQSDNDDWNALLSSYGNSSIPLQSGDKMKKSWFGFASFIGFRFYLFPWLAFDVKTGFMNNYYKPENWKFQGKKITGPDLKLDKLPLFTGRIIIGW